MNSTETGIVTRLMGQRLPDVALPATDGSWITLSSLEGRSVVYAYPRTSPPSVPPIAGWDQIPGARGCTPQCKGFAAQHSALLAAGVTRVFGLSSQTTEYQQEVVRRLALPFPLLSDHTLTLAAALGLPTFEAGGMTLLTRLTLIIEDGHVARVFYPVSQPEQNAADVLTALTG